MNALIEDQIRMRARICSALVAMMDEDYKAWVRMTPEMAFHEVMKRTRGIVNPKMVKEILTES